MQVPSGFLPVPSLDAFPVACGNDGKASLILADGTVKPLGDVGAPSGWLGRELALSQGVELWPKVYGRALAFLNIDTGVMRQSGYDVTQDAGYRPQIACKNGRVVSSTPGQFYLDGQKIATEADAVLIEDFDGTHILYPVFQHGRYTFVVKNLDTGADLHRVPRQLSYARLDLLVDGPWLSWAEDSRMFVLSPTGQTFIGPANEGRGLLFDHEGVRYAVTITNHGWTPVWIIRKFSEWPSGPAWTLNVGFDGMQYADGQAMGYVNDGTGTLTIEPVPFGTPMTPYVKPVEPPEPVPMPAIITGLSIPRPTEPLPACWFGGWAGKHGPNVPGTMQCSRYQMSDHRPTMEQICRWPIPLDVPLLCGYLGSDDGADYTDQEIAAVKARPDGRAIYIHVDDPAHEARMMAVRSKVVSAGLVAIMGVHAAAGGAEEIKRLSERARIHASYGPWGIMRSYHFSWDGRKYWRDPATMLAAQAEFTELRRTIPGCVIDALFGWDRPGGRLQCVELADYAHDLARLTTRPARLIGEPEPIVIVQPPVVVKPKWPWGNSDSPVIKKPGKRGTLG